MNETIKTRNLEERILLSRNKILKKGNLTFLDKVKVILIYIPLIIVRCGKFLKKKINEAIVKTNWEHVKYFVAGASAVLLTAAVAYFGISIIDAARNLGPNVSNYNFLRFIAKWL